MTEDVRRLIRKCGGSSSFLPGEEGSQGVVGWVAFRIWGVSTERRVEATSRDGGRDVWQADNLVLVVDISWVGYSQHAFLLGRASQFCFRITAFLHPYLFQDVLAPASAMGCMPDSDLVFSWPWQLWWACQPIRTMEKQPWSSN